MTQEKENQEFEDPITGSATPDAIREELAQEDKQPETQTDAATLVAKLMGLANGVEDMEKLNHAMQAFIEHKGLVTQFQGFANQHGDFNFDIADIVIENDVVYVRGTIIKSGMFEYELCDHIPVRREDEINRLRERAVTTNSENANRMLIAAMFLEKQTDEYVLRDVYQCDYLTKSLHKDKFNQAITKFLADNDKFSPPADDFICCPACA